MKRVCGECQACCWFYPLAFMANKPMRTNCQFQCAGGCAIYGQKRHSTCEDFKCEWLVRFDWDEALRPDRCGIIFNARATIAGGKLLIQASQFNPYCWLRPVNRKQIDRLVQAGHIVLRSFEDDEGTDRYVHRDERRHPGVTTEDVLRLLRKANCEARQHQSAVTWTASALPVVSQDSGCDVSPA